MGLLHQRDAGRTRTIVGSWLRGAASLRRAEIALARRTLACASSARLNGGCSVPTLAFKRAALAVREEVSRSPARASNPVWQSAPGAGSCESGHRRRQSWSDRTSRQSRGIHSESLTTLTKVFGDSPDLTTWSFSLPVAIDGRVEGETALGGRIEVPFAQRQDPSLAIVHAVAFQQPGWISAVVQ